MTFEFAPSDYAFIVSALKEKLVHLDKLYHDLPNDSDLLEFFHDEIIDLTDLIERLDTGVKV